MVPCRPTNCILCCQQNIQTYLIVLLRAEFPRLDLYAPAAVGRTFKAGTLTVPRRGADLDRAAFSAHEQEVLSGTSK